MIMNIKKRKFSFASNLKIKEFYHFIILLIIPCFLFCAALTGCSKVEVSPDGTGTGTGTATENQPSAITVTIQDPNIGIGEVIPVTATVTDSEGNPVDAGFQIDFSITPSNLGMFTPNNYVNTSNSGDALIYLFTLAPGSGVITAQFSGTGAWGALSIDIVGDPNTVVDPNSIPVPPPLTGTGIIGSITLSKGADSIVADGSSYVYISAQVTDTAGLAMPDNTIVTFSTTGGDIDPLTGGIQSTVNAFTTNGIAQTTLTSSTNVGKVTIIASCNGFNTDETVEFIPGPSATIIVEAFPDLLVPDGESSSNIVVTVYDINNNPVADDTILTFSANFGELSTLLATTTKGVGTVTYTAPDSSPPGGTDTVTVEAPNEQTGNVVINLSGISGDPNAPTYPVGSITVSAGSQKIVADGATSVTISAEVKDTIGVSIPDGTIVTFTTTAGDIDPNTAGIQNMVTALTADGIARIRMASSTKTGIATITAESGGFNDNTTVEFIPGPPATVIVQASPADLVADGLSQSTITITVLDAHNNPVSDGTQLNFDTTDGELSSILGITSVGEATVTYIAPGYVPAGGNDTVTAETTNEITGSAVINLSGAQVAGITLSAEPESLPADGLSKATITAVVTIIGGGTAPDDTPVDFDIISGGGTFQIGGGIHTQSFTAGGVAIARIISDPNVGTATIQATSGGITEEIQITYTPGTVILTITPNSLLGTADETANVVASLIDASGSPAADGEMVTFTLSDGTLGSLVDPNGQSITDPNGRAFAFSSGGQGKVSVVFKASEKDGTITISAKWSPGGIDIIGSASAIILPSPADIRIADGFPDPMSISIKGTGGVATSRLTFDVTDAHSNPVPDGYRIDFTIQSGPNGGETIIPITALTENGQVTTLLRSGTKAGPVSVKAYYYHDSEVSTTTSSIAISAGPPVGEEFGISAQYRNVSGLWIDGIENGITIRAGDISGNAVPDDTAISFKTYNTGGTMVPGSSETIDGAASSILESSSPKPSHGFLSVTAEATNGGRTTHVTSIAVTPSPDNSIIYAGTDGGGLYKSTDGGYSWETVSRSSTISGQNWIDPYINAISVDPDNYNVVYAATGYLGKGNVFRSLDGGLNWNSDDPEEWNGIFNTNKAILDVLCDDGGSPYVWIGTDSLGALYSSDGENFSWGGTVSASGGTIDLGGVYSFDIAKGTMSEPTLSFSSKTESWTVTYQKTGATASMPRFTGSSADGTMPYDELSVTEFADTETWTIRYVGGFDPDPNINDPNDRIITGKGTLYVISTSEFTEDETWTLTYRDPNVGGWPQAGFYVFGTKSGPGAIYSDFTQTYTSANDEVSFFINQIGQFAEGDQFSFTTKKDAWSVEGSISGNKSNARTDVPYISDGLEVSFTVHPGEKKFYKNGDTWTFDTTATGNWRVAGTVSGIQNSVAETGILYRSDYNEVTFTISFGGNQFTEGDKFEFDVQDSGLGYGRTVREIIKVPGTNGATAQLYAATGRGVFKTTNGGVIWNETTSFTGDNITTIALDPDNPNVIYAGTEDNGVWVSLNGGATWTKQSDGLGKGLGATEPLPNPGNKGNGTMSAVTVDPNVLTETWTIACKTEAIDGGVFSVTGSRSGSQSDATVGVSYASDNGSVSFIIYDGTFDFEVGDAFSFDTVRDPGANIKDLLVDTANNKLYAITYFLGPLEAHAVGNLYVHDLQADGSFVLNDWREANQGLPQYDPPDDITLFAQHALAIDNPAAPGVLYIGGEGINLHRAESNLATGSLVWEQSKSGMTNLIMARMPILFSGECTMDIRENIISGNLVNFTVYIQDINGNPPVAGSTFIVKHITPDSTFILTDVTYPDCYTHQGTFSNPADASTNNPYVFWVMVNSGDDVEFTFTTSSSSYPNPPGTSGADETVTYLY
jgi:hypothetical protein